MMPRSSGRLLVAMACLATALGLAGQAQAKASVESPYSYQQTFGSALRLIKVDLDLRVTEINGEWGYFTFEYLSRESGDRKNRGSFSFVRGRDEVQVTLQIPQMPSYHEQLLVDKLKRKLGEEHGAPPRHAKKKPPPEDDDDKADRDDDSTKSPRHDDHAENDRPRQRRAPRDKHGRRRGH